MISKQLHLSDFIDDFHKFIVFEKPILLQLLQQYINIHELIPIIWHLNYNKSIGRPHDNSLASIVSTLLLQKLLSMTTANLLITFLSFSKELHDFCGLKTVPDTSFYSRFKQDYHNDMKFFFDKISITPSPMLTKL